jgi:hypothetical protein
MREAGFRLGADETGGSYAFAFEGLYGAAGAGLGGSGTPAPKPLFWYDEYAGAPYEFDAAILGALTGAGAGA